MNSTKTIYSEKAVSCFRNKFNCAQSVLCALSVRTGMDENTSLKVATAFGGGIARNQQVCGAVSGALMALSLVHGSGLNNSDENKAKTYELSNQFIDAFKKLHKETDCLSLLGADMHTEEGEQKIKAGNLFVTKCEKFVADATDLASKYL